MSAEELDCLWDPALPASPANRDIADWESRLSSLRAPDLVPALRLAPREPQLDSTLEASRNESLGPMLAAAGFVLAAGALVLWFSRGAVSEANPPVARAPIHRPGQAPAPVEAPVQAPVQAQEGWRVSELSGEGMCRQPGVEPGALLPAETTLDTGPDGPARLTNGAAQVDLHPNGQLRHDKGTLVLEAGRLWAELPPRVDGQTWKLRVGTAALETNEARFVLWDQAGSELGIDVVSGQVSLRTDTQSLQVNAGDKCVAAHAPLPVAGHEAFACTLAAGD